MRIGYYDNWSHGLGFEFLIGDQDFGFGLNFRDWIGNWGFGFQIANLEQVFRLRLIARGIGIEIGIRIEKNTFMFNPI